MSILQNLFSSSGSSSSSSNDVQCKRRYLALLNLYSPTRFTTNDSLRAIQKQYEIAYRLAHTKQQSAEQIAKWFRYWYVFRKQLSEQLRKHVKNECCFYSMEPYDRKQNPGPYFYHIADEKNIIHEFDPVLLCRFLQESNHPINPFTKQKLNKPELMRLNRLRKYKQPMAPSLDIETLSRWTPFGSDSDNGGSDMMQIEFNLQAIQSMFAHMTGQHERRDHERRQQRSSGSSAINYSEFADLLRDRARDQSQESRNRQQIQQLFRSTPIVMLDFIRSEMEHADQEHPRRRRFVRDLLVLTAEHFDLPSE